MPSPAVSPSQVAYARLAGFMYIFVIVVYLSGDALVGSLRVPDDFAATAANIRAAEPLQRLGLTAQFISSLCTIPMAVGLYVALRPVDRDLALMALACRLAEATLGGVGSRFAFGLMQVHLTADLAEPGQMAGLATVLRASQSAGFHSSILFFSCGSLIFFWLFLRSGYIPRALAILGLVASTLTPLVSFGHLLLPSPPPQLQLGWAPMFLAEISVGLWLLFKGVSSKSTPAPNTASPKRQAI